MGRREVESGGWGGAVRTLFSPLQLCPSLLLYESEMERAVRAVLPIEGAFCVMALDSLCQVDDDMDVLLPHEPIMI